MAKEKKADKKGGDVKGKGKGKAKDAAKAQAHDPLIERFRAAALKLKADKVLPCSADVRVAEANVLTGLQSVFGAPEDPARKKNVAAIKEALPELSTRKVLELPELAQAVALAAAKEAPPKSEAEDLRDRLWTLLVQRHGDLRVMGYYRFRDEFDRATPKLLAPVVEAKAAEEAQASAPEPADAAASAPEPAGGEASAPEPASGEASAPN